MSDPALPGVARRAIFDRSRTLWPRCQWTTRSLEDGAAYRVTLELNRHIVQSIRSSKLLAMRDCFDLMTRRVE